MRERLGRTATHPTWRAVREHGGRPVVLRVPVAPSPTRVEIARLHHEVEITARLPAEAVVRALAVEQWRTSPALVLEDIDGVPQSSRISSRLALRTVLHLGHAIAGAVAAVHGAGVITRTSSRPTSSSARSTFA